MGRGATDGGILNVPAGRTERPCRPRSRSEPSRSAASALLAMANVLRTYVYVDGFNLYYRALKNTRFKWLNLERLVKDLLDPENEISCIRYFTAPVSGKLDPAQPIRQQTYL